MEKQANLSFNYPQIPSLSVPLLGVGQGQTTDTATCEKDYKKKLE